MTVSSANVLKDEDAILQNNTHMTRFGDANFCLWIMKQLKPVARWHMVEPFIRLPGQTVDIQTINQRLQTGGYPDAATLQEELLSIPADWLKNNAGQTHRHVKANDLLLELPALFRSRNRVDNAYRRSQQQQPPAVSSNSANSGVGAAQDPAQGTIQDAARGAAQDAASAVPAGSGAAPPLPSPSPIPSMTHSLPYRFSATPGPSRRPTNRSDGRVPEVQASNGRASGRLSRAGPDITTREASETVDHDSELRQARFGKKRATSGDNIGTNSKRARQETPKYKYR